MTTPATRYDTMYFREGVVVRQIGTSHDGNDSSDAISRLHKIAAEHHGKSRKTIGLSLLIDTTTGEPIAMALPLGYTSWNGLHYVARHPHASHDFAWASNVFEAAARYFEIPAYRQRTDVLNGDSLVITQVLTP